jgi:hypothetical protein
MMRSRKPLPTAGGSSVRLCIALVFLLAAGISALANADTRSVEGFDIDTVILRGSDQLKIEWKDSGRLLVKGDQEDLDLEPFYVRGKTLYLGYTEGRKQVSGVKYLLEVDTLERIELQGSGVIWINPVVAERFEVELEGSGDMRLHEVNADKLELTLAGSGNIQLARAATRELILKLAGSGDIDLGTVETDTLKVELSGSGDIIADGDGSAREVDIGLAGSGDVDIQSIRAPRVDVGIAGSGDVYVWAEKYLETGIIGSGDVHYRGEPELDTSLMGNGGVTPID